MKRLVKVLIATLSLAVLFFAAAGVYVGGSRAVKTSLLVALLLPLFGLGVEGVTLVTRTTYDRTTGRKLGQETYNQLGETIGQWSDALKRVRWSVSEVLQLLGLLVLSFLGLFLVVLAVHGIYYLWPRT